jgi:transposase
MTAFELIRALAQDADIGVLVTDAVVDAPGPTILYANSAFGRLGRLCKGVHRLGGQAHVGLMRRFELTDAQWEQIAPLLPPQKPRTGRPAEDHRQVLNGMLWILRTGAPWEDLPARYGAVGTVSSRFYRWRKAGVFDRVLQRLQAQADARGDLNWDLHFVDATVVRAHQHAAGARRSGAIGG